MIGNKEDIGVKLDYVNVLDFGAKGDAIIDIGLNKYVGTDNTLAFQKALDTAKNVLIPKGNYLISSQLVPNSNTIIFGNDKNATKLIFDKVINGDDTTYFNMFFINNSNDITIKNIGFCDSSNFEYTELLTFSTACEAIAIRGTETKRISVLNCDFSYIHGHGVHDESTEAYNVFNFNTGKGVGQNVLNINSKFPTIQNNKGSYNGFGLIEASCGNGLIQFNEASYNYKKGITIGGFAGPVSDGFGSNNIISHNISFRNAEDGIHLAAHCVDSIISDNVCYENGKFGISSVEPNDIFSNLTITKNKVYNNGLATEISKAGIYISSKGNLISYNEIYNKGLGTDYNTTYGISIDYAKHYQTIHKNVFTGISNWDISIYENESINIDQYEYDRIEILGNVSITDKISKVVIAYNGQPITLTQTYLYADNISSSKLAVLPPAEKYPEGQILYVVDEKGSAAINNITLQTQTGDKANGIENGSFVINQNYGVLKLINIKSSKTWISI